MIGGIGNIASVKISIISFSNSADEHHDVVLEVVTLFFFFFFVIKLNTKLKLIL